MADVRSSIFNQKATEKLRSPDDLDKYVRVTNPSVWIVLVVCIALLVGLLAWGAFGSVTTSVSTTGTIIEGKALCMLSAEDVAKVNAGDAAVIGGESVKVERVTSAPLSRGEVASLVTSDYLVSTLMTGDWAYVVFFEGDISGLAENVPLSVSITTERIAPLSLVLGGNK